MLRATFSRWSALTRCGHRDRTSVLSPVLPGYLDRDRRLAARWRSAVQSAVKAADLLLKALSGADSNT